MDYVLYLQTDEWRSVRRLIWRRAAGKCERCKAHDHDSDGEQVHHLTYEHIFEEIDHLDDLILLCRPCHEYVHGRRKEDPCNMSFADIARRLNRL